MNCCRRWPSAVREMRRRTAYECDQVTILARIYGYFITCTAAQPSSYAHEVGRGRHLLCAFARGYPVILGDSDGYRHAANGKTTTDLGMDMTDQTALVPIDHLTRRPQQALLNSDPTTFKITICDLKAQSLPPRCRGGQSRSAQRQ
jgi:hypothetical protein